MNLLVLGGTAEGRQLASALHRRPGYAVTSSLAGRVSVPTLPCGEVRVGGFGGVAGLINWLREHHTDVVVDATHPFATRMTSHAVAATAALGLPLLVLCREGWTAGPGDRWHRVPSPEAAAAMLPELGERVFLATGSGNLAAFAGLDLWCVVRAVDPPPPPLPRRVHLILGRGPFTADAERALLREHRIDVVVTRDSGGEMTAAKLVAARELGLPVVLLARPPAPDAPVLATVEEVVRRLDGLVRSS
ncbi:MAG: cobalt-precorrin-6A reductase [Pseudonocardia sp.]|nr:cobalt-precorrin-6A reductase [Pseudonocardia sp.]